MAKAVSVKVGERYLDKDKRGDANIHRVIEISEIRPRLGVARVVNVEHSVESRIGEASNIKLSRFIPKHFAKKTVETAGILTLDNQPPPAKEQACSAGHCD